MRRSSQGLLTFMLLGATLVLAGILAYAAVDATRQHRLTAQTVLRDYVTFASEQFAQRFTQELEYYGLYPVMQLLTRIETDLPAPASLVAGADEQMQQSIELANVFFRYNGDGVLETSPGASLPPNFTTTLRAEIQQTPKMNVISGFVTIANIQPRTPRIFFFHTGTESAPTIVGFEAKFTAMRDYADTVFGRTQLLPPSVTGELENDEIFSMAVLHANGDTLWTITNGDGTELSLATGIRGAYPLGEKWPDVELHATLLDSVTNQLIAAGVPASRVPMTMTLAFATAALLIATVVQVVRKRSLAKLRAEFVSSVSHELRTPLAQIRMFAETLRLGRMESSADRDRSLAVIDKEARRLTNLVENVLLFSKPTLQMTTGDLAETKLDALMMEVADGYRPLADARAVSMDMQIEPVIAPVDAPALKQSLLNLVDNAIKYGPEARRFNCPSASSTATHNWQLKTKDLVSQKNTARTYGNGSNV